jgi:hypothetical protein
MTASRAVFIALVAAHPVFVAGPGVKAGLIGATPKLLDFAYSWACITAPGLTPKQLAVLERRKELAEQCLRQESPG